MKQLVSRAIERGGLALINGLARSGNYRFESRRFGDHARQGYDCYSHVVAGTPATRPLVVFFYGGNWQSGRRRDYRFVGDTLHRAGFDVAIPDYRLYPEVRFDAILDDAVAAVTTIATRHPAVPIVIVGHSAGAQIGALLTLDATLLTTAVRSRLVGFVGLAGPYDFHPFTEEPHADLFGPPDRHRLSQPVNFVHDAAPPLYLLHGAEDRRVRRGHSKSLLDKVTAAGGNARREVYENTGHVDIILEFAAPYRRRSPVVRDVARFIQTTAGAHDGHNTLEHRRTPRRTA